MANEPRRGVVVADGICPTCGARLGPPTALAKGGVPGTRCRQCLRVWAVECPREADEINDDDLQAAADMLDDLEAGTHYEKQAAV